MSEAQLFTGPAAEWAAFVATQPQATIAHAYAWRRIIERVYGHDCPYLVTRENGRITGALPLVDVRSIPFGRLLVSMPYLNAGGPLGDAAATRALSDAALSLAQERRARLVELRCVQPVLNGRPHGDQKIGALNLSASQEKVACALRLPGDVETMWAALGGKLRSQIRRPQKEGIEVRFGSDQLEPFYRVFARNMRDLGTPPHPRRFFESIQEELSDEHRVIGRSGDRAIGLSDDRMEPTTRVWFGCAYLRGEPVAGGCALAWQNEAEMTWASSLRAYNALAPNMLLYWAFIERAVSEGMQRFNFGRCTPGSGSHRFKLQWGASDEPLFWYRWPDGERAPRQDQGPLAVASRLWRRVPVPLSTLLGPRLRKGIPA